MSHGLLVSWFTLFHDLKSMSTANSTYFQVIGFLLGCMGYILSSLTTRKPDWKILLTENTTKYMSGVTRIGPWKMCFPPSLSGPSNNSSLVCCHNFAFFEKFLPLEMKCGQFLMCFASFCALMGLIFSFLVPWNIFCQMVSLKVARWMFVTGGILCVISSICIFVCVSWNVYSVAQNKTITFLPYFYLPPAPAAQRNGSTVYIGYASGTLLLVSGLCFIARRDFIKQNKVTPS